MGVDELFHLYIYLIFLALGVFTECSCKTWEEFITALLIVILTHSSCLNFLSMLECADLKIQCIHFLNIGYFLSCVFSVTFFVGLFV